MLREGRSSWVNQNQPGTEYGNTDALRIQSGTAIGLVQFGFPAGLRVGATFSTVKLRIPLRLAVTGTRTVTVRRADAPWRPRKLNWNNRPGATGTGTTITVGPSPAGTLLDFDVSVDTQTWLNEGGGTHPGWLVTTNAGTRMRIDGIPGARLEMDYSFKPAAPTDLNPSSGFVSVAKPVLQFTAGPISQLQVQIATEPTFAAPVFDSGWVLTTAKEYDLAASTYAGLASGQTVYWQVRVRNAAGQESPWSAAATFSRLAKPALTFVEPTDFVYDSQHPIEVSMTGLERLQVVIARADTGKVLLDSGEQVNPTGLFVPPKPVFTSEDLSYRVTARAWDDQDRESTPGDPAWVEATTVVTLNYSLVTTGPDQLILTQVDNTPAVQVGFYEDTPGDAYTIARSDGWSRRVDIADWDVADDGRFSFVDWTCPPNVPVTYTIRPHADDQEGPGISATMATMVGGQWLVDPDTGDYVVVISSEELQWVEQDLAAEHVLEGSGYVARRVFGKQKPTFPVSGYLIDSELGNLADFAPRLRAWGDPEVTDASKVFRFVAGDENLLVWVGHVSVAPTSHTQLGQVVKSVGFTVWQAREDT